jgi:hypothetical protein
LACLPIGVAVHESTICGSGDNGFSLSSRRRIHSNLAKILSRYPFIKVIVQAAVAVCRQGTAADNGFNHSRIQILVQNSKKYVEEAVLQCVDRWLLLTTVSLSVGFKYEFRIPKHASCVCVS